MSRTILYYPNINVPTSGPWIRSALLYWDKLAAIVPRSYDDMQDEEALQRYSDDIQCLYRDEIFRPVNPDSLMQKAAGRKRFESEVNAHIKALTKDPFYKNAPLDVPVFKQKLSGILFEKLKRAGVAEERNKTRKDHYCYYFHPKAADIYMALLADYLAKEDSELTIPGSDQKIAFDQTFNHSSGAAKDLCVAAKLFDILPCPTEDTTLRKILDFRKKHRSEILGFRDVMDSFETGLTSAEDERAINAFVIRSKEKIEKECLNLESALKGVGIITFLGSIQSFFKAPSVYLVAGTSVLLGQASEVAKVPIKYGLGSAVATGLIDVSIQYLKQRRENKANLLAKPFAYLFLAKKELRLK